MRRYASSLIVAVALALTGCASRTSHTQLRSATLVLDFTPNAVHTGVYAAIRQGFVAAAHLRLTVLAPSASTDSIKLLETGRVAFAILDIHDLAIAQARGAQLVGVMAIVERPLAAVIAAPSVGNPRQLVGRLVGITGVPSDTAVLRSVVAGAGGDPARVRTITIGFSAVPDLLARRVDAATAFWSDEGVTLQLRRPGFHAFRVDAYGAPSYPELVLCAALRTVASDRRLVRSVVGALTRGYEFTVANPARAASELESAVAGLDPQLVAAQLHALTPAFRAPDGRVGVLQAGALLAWARWEARFKIVARPPDVARLFDLPG
jgi:putative hydroxymethylpyrimidine transport system substrate-binding protein